MRGFSSSVFQLFSVSSVLKPLTFPFRQQKLNTERTEKNEFTEIYLPNRRFASWSSELFAPFGVENGADWAYEIGDGEKRPNPKQFRLR
jgi:hypothetical protein